MDRQEYECDICLDEVTVDEDKALSCFTHIFCDDCAKQSFELAARDQEAFPANCCGHSDPLDTKHFEHVFPPHSEFTKEYETKLAEHRIHPLIRVYCSNPACATWIPPKLFQDSERRFTIASCTKCDQLTCVACKKPFSKDSHVCAEKEDVAKSIPPYDPDGFRYKKCPSCRTIIELKEACNHMTCQLCHHDFCFVCLIPWRQNGENCPSYGDPPVGYDEEGYEKSDRGIHRDTGFDRAGYNRLGLDAHGQLRPQNENLTGVEGIPPEELDPDVQAVLLMGTDGDVDAAEQEQLERELRDELNAQDFERAMLEEFERRTLEQIQPGEEPVPEDQEEASVQGWEYYSEADTDYGWQSEEQWYCAHSFTTRRGIVSFQDCGVDSTDTFCEECDWCGLGICTECYWDDGYHALSSPFREGSMVAVILWAEQGGPPFRLEQKEEAEARYMRVFEPKYGGFGTNQLFTYYEKLYEEKHPFMYEDYGLPALFPPWEMDYDIESPHDTIHNVGLRGLTMTRYDENYFRVLQWVDTEAEGDTEEDTEVPEALLDAELPLTSFRDYCEALLMVLLNEVVAADGPPPCLWDVEEDGYEYIW